MTSAARRLEPLVVFKHIGTPARTSYESATTNVQIRLRIHFIDLPPDANQVEHPSQQRPFG